ncbi:MAG: NgoFVII family restriction endonuclease [Victivallales bacterium]|jgi:hypothetical protein|nr:NgoFVII family restriction endonuclease [Victivallales bacterium]
MGSNNFLTTWKDNVQYFATLAALAKFSKLFTAGSIPYLDYRITENIFCKYYEAHNQARSCTAYDATISSMGVGIKTFILKNNQSAEKIAEFNKLKNQLDLLTGIALAQKLGQFRNDRIQVADTLYGTSDRIYHIIGRADGGLRIFNTTYDLVDVEKIKIIQDDSSSIFFHDGKNEYHFNRSKTVLIQKFIVPPNDIFDVCVDFIADPLSFLLEILRKTDITMTSNNMPSVVTSNIDYIILPLYSTRNRIPLVPEKSGLNQWNAGGRRRDPDEVYIPIPKKVRETHPNFFPSREEPFTLQLPNGRNLSAKICQDDGKALMSYHNADLGQWILRTILQKNEGELVTMDDLNRFGIDSVRIVNMHTEDDGGRRIYTISFTATGYESYSEFIGEE